MNCPRILRLSAASSVLLFAVVPYLMPTLADEWKPISPADLALKENPASPGDHAMILYREEFVNDVTVFRTNYIRIKIFDEEGKEYGDVKIFYDRDISRIDSIQARTIQPDGSIIKFDGQVMDQLARKTKNGREEKAKTFTLPDVQPGSIIEYKYTTWLRKSDIDVGGDVFVTYFYRTEWLFQGELFTREAHFTLLPNLGDPNKGDLYRLALMWQAFNLPGGMQPQVSGTLYQMNMTNIPALVEEDHMLPESELQMRMEFFYSATVRSPDQYWKDQAKELTKESDAFIGKHGPIAQETSRVIAGSDSPEAKLRKLYARAQEIRNLSYAPQRTEQETKRENTAAYKSVEDVLRTGAGSKQQINRLFVAMARAAGFDAAEAYVARRNLLLFHPEVQVRGQLTDNLVWVHAGNQEYFLDPATKFCPFGLLPWQDNDSRGIRLGKVDSPFIQTPPSRTEDATTERKVTVSIEPDQSIGGTFQISYRGQEALGKRLYLRNSDDVGRKKWLTENLQSLMPSGTSIELTSLGDWTSSEQPLVVQGTFKLARASNSSANNVLLPLTLFTTQEVSTFSATQRAQDIYFDYPLQELDDITIQIPAGYKVEGLPPGKQTKKGAALEYEISATQEGSNLHVHRRFAVNGILVQAKYYAALRRFASEVKSGDQLVVLLSGQANGQ